MIAVNTMPDENSAMIYARVPRNLKKKFKMLCEEQGVSMRDKVVDLMSAGIKMNKAPDYLDDGKPTIFFVRSLPVDAKRQFKAWCDLQGLTLEKGLASMMEMGVKNG